MPAVRRPDAPSRGLHKPRDPRSGSSAALRGGGAWWALVAVWLALGWAPGADAATAVYYSVGTSVADLKSGAPTVTIASGVATFSAAQPNNVGVGDEITYGGATRAYISGRTSSSQYAVTTATGAVPPNVGGATVNQIRRAFNLLSVAESGSSDATHLNTANLVAANVQLNWACYNDGPPMNDGGINITGYTTGAAQYIRIFTPTSSSQVGASQRHIGVAGSGFRLRPVIDLSSPAVTWYSVLYVFANYMRIEGIEIDGSQVTQAAGVLGIRIDQTIAPTADIRIDKVIIHDITNSSRLQATSAYIPYGIELEQGNAKVSDSIIYAVHNNNNNAGSDTHGIRISSTNTGTVYIHSNTIYDIKNLVAAGSLTTGISRSSGSTATVTVKNTAVLNVTSVGGAPTCFAGTMTQSNNVSSDATAAGTGSQINKNAYATYFRNTTMGSEDLHLTNYSLSLWGSNGADLSANASLPVTDDIDGAPRIRPDIGADEFGTCCALSTAEVPGSTVTVTGAGQFEMRFNQATGAGIDRFFDLAEDPARATDLAGGTSRIQTLFDDGIFDGSNFYDPNQNSLGAKLDVLEATSTRVKVRQEAFYQLELGSAILPGVKGLGDYSIYPAGRLALRWNRRTTAPVTYTIEQLSLVVHADSVAPVNNWSPFSSGGGVFPQSGLNPFMLVRSEISGARTDFLNILSRDWTTPAYFAQADRTNWQADTATEKWGIAFWEESTGATLPVPPAAGSNEVFNFLTYFKPTNFTSGADTAVTSRVSDYRTAATPVINAGKGSQWQDANENSSTGGDFYNESEAVYVFDLDPSLGLDFNLDGTTTTRYSPFFKIRRWRSAVAPQTITVDGIARTRDVHFKADVKPVSFAVFADSILWHSTLENAAALTTAPDIGSGGTMGPGVIFTAGRYGAGAQIPSNNDWITFPTASGFDKAAGAVEFWFQPTWASNDGARHDIGGSYVNVTNQFLLQKLANNTLHFTIVTSAGTSDLVVAAAAYSWRAADWVHIILEWNDSLSLANQQQLYVNGLQPAHTDPIVDYNSALLTLDTDFYLGNISGIGSASYADGIYDEVYSYSLSAQDASSGILAHGGLTSSPLEFLASPSNNATLSLDAVNGTRQGEYLYLAADSRFRGLNVVLATAGAGTANLQWQFWNGTAWADLEAVAGFADSTNNLKLNGNIFWTVDPAGWSPSSLAGGPDLYYVRAYVASGSYAPSPVESRITTDILLFQNCGDVTTNSNFVFAAPVPTEVKLQSFSAVPGDASVVLEWRTASELDNLGFHLYRGPSESGPWIRLTASLIPGLGSSAVGQAYSYRDTGLVNGTRYFYRLEDVDASSKTTSHGPVSAVPLAGAAGGAPGSEPPASRPSAKKKGVASASCPDWVVAAYGSLAGASASSATLTCTRHGEPEAVSFGVVSRDSRSATLELKTGGFYALHEASGRVRVFVPGFDFPQDPQAPALPFRRALVDAVVGRSVQLGGVRASDQVGFPGLVPTALGKMEMQVSRDGTVRAGRRALRDSSPRHVSIDLARLLPSVFQGETKSAVVVLMPLRYDARRQRIVLAKRLLVRLLFAGREIGESGRGSFGRREKPQKPVTGELLARLYTTDRGLYAVPFDQLFSGRGRALAASQLRLERQGQAQGFHVEPAGDLFGPGSVLYFYADTTAASTDFSSETAWELLRARDGVPMPLVSAAPAGDAVTTASTGQASFKTNRFYQPGLLDAPDLWLWDGLASGMTSAKSFSLAGVNAGSSQAAVLEVFLQGASESGNAIDHHVSVSLNGTLVGETQFAGKTAYRMSLAVPPSLLHEGANELSLTNVADTGVSSYVFLDRFSVAYPQTSALASGLFDGTWNESGTATVSGTAAALLDVTMAPSWLQGYETTGGSLRFRAEAGHRYLAVSQQALFTPRVAAPAPSSLRSTQNQADYLLIAPRAFLAAAEPLQQRRQDQGLQTRAVAFEEISDEFGHGQPSAEAIKSFLAFAFQSWARPSPRYVLLLGDSSYDPRNFTGMSQPSPLPALWTKTSYLWTVSDPELAAVNGDDELPDLAIGRLPATTVAEANSLVQKLLAWEDSGQGLSGAALLVADNPDLAGDFEADIDNIAQSFLQGREVRELKLSELGGATRPAILDAMNSGLSLVSYVGHGGAAVWASENVWNSWDAASLQAQSRQPFLMTLNCLNGYFVAPAFNSLAESLLKVEGRGAIASFSPSGLSEDGPAHQYHRALMAELTSGRHQRLGDAVLAAQKAYAEAGLMPELLEVYHLLGDPATRITP